MAPSRRRARFLSILTTMSVVLLGPVAFGAGIAAADEPAPGVAVETPQDAGTPPVGTEPGPQEDPAGTGEDGGSGEEGSHGEGSAVLVCLATANPDAPYTAALVMPTAIITGESRVKGDGPAASPIEGVFPSEPWGSIVPPVTHPSGATFGGLNFGSDGQAIWNAGCGVGDPVTPPDGGHGGSGHGEHATVVVCIATADTVTPYLLEEWMVQEIINGHGVPKKDGPASDPVEGVFPDAVWGNIVPVVTHPNGKATFEGLNFDVDGQAIWQAGCVYVAPAAPPPAPGPGPAPVDFCPDLDGLQWENYDCNTPQAPVVDTATPPPPAVGEAPVSAVMPAVVPVATTPTLPASIPAGALAPRDAPGWALLVLVLAALGAAGALARMTFSQHD